MIRAMIDPKILATKMCFYQILHVVNEPKFFTVLANEDISSTSNDI